MAALPRRRGLGAGTAMLRYGLDRARRLGLPVYLEASTPRNRKLYARHGFHDLGDPIHLPDGGPTLQPMWHGGQGPTAAGKPS
jgi:GNAT superfamily N-acetyltransferase